MVRASDRGLLGALAMLFVLLVGAILVLAPATESDQPPWIVGEAAAQPASSEPDADGPPPAFERMQVFADRRQGLPAGVSSGLVSVQGRVRMRDGSFVAGAVIHASAGSRDGDEPWALRLAGPQRSLGGGFFAFDTELATPCILVLHVQHRELPPATFVREVAAGTREVDLGYLVLDAGAMAEGRVVDAASRPIAGARVRLVPLMESPAGLATVSDSFFAARNAVTDRSGSYRLERIVPGDWMLEVSADGHQSARTTGFTILPGPDNSVELVVLRRARELAVKVVDPEGRAVPDAIVRATEQRSGLVHTARVVQPGEYAFSQLPDAVLDVEAVSPRFRRAVLRGIESAEERDVLVRLQRGLVVSGRATDTTGRPVERFAVAVVPDDGSGPGADRAEREARGQRRVVLQRMRELAATVDGRAEVRRLLQQEDAKLAEGAAGREALLGGSMDARALAALDLGDPPTSTTWPGGLYELAGLEDGRVQVVFHAPGCAPLWSEPFDLAGQDMIVDVEFHAGHSLRGFVRDASGQAVGGARVRAIPRDRGIEAAMRSVACGIDAASTAADGSFALRGIPAGGWALVVSAEGCVPLVGETLAVEGDRQGLVLTVQRVGALEGRVAGAAGSQQVEVLAVPIGSGSAALRPGRTLAAPDGSYRIEGLEPGPYAMRAFRVPAPAGTGAFLEQARAGVLAVDVLVAAGSTTTFDLAAPEPPGAVVGGIVYDAGRPGRGLVVAVRTQRGTAGPGEESSYATIAETAVDPEGRFRFTDLPPGACELTVQFVRNRPAILAAQTLVLAPGAEQSVRFEVATCQLHGSVMLPDGMDATGLRARLLRAGEPVQFEVTMASGEFRFDRVPAGDWQLLVEKPGLRHAMAVRLEAGFRNELIVDATGAGTRLRARGSR